ncbi:MAG TPA: zf-HC2 domain-containing protein [Thermoanaerobaculia bacterium]|nr:zf-HC2 domain-containing protein [Thermoanaerobaculia bacterium]
MTAARETCPSCEELAAFLDGKLSPEERAWGIEHLAGCESCYALFSEVVRFREESAAEAKAEEEAARPSAPFEWRAGWRRWLPAALPWRPVVATALAAALLAAIGIPVYRYFTVVPELDSAGLLASLHGKEGQLTDKIRTSVLRGPDDRRDRDISIDSESFQLGVQLVDLRLAMEANDKVRTQETLQRIVAILQGSYFPPKESIRRYTSLRERVDSTPPRTLLGEAAALERIVPEAGLDPPHLSFGKWAEAGRLAAAAEESRFFTSRETRQFLTAFAHQRGDDRLLPEEAQEIAGIRASLARSPLDLQAIGDQLDRIVASFNQPPAS